MIDDNSKEFIYRHIGPAEDEQAKMLEAVGYKTLKDLMKNTVPEKGTSVVKDGNAGVVESTKAASDVYTPVSGEITDNNQSIVDDPAKINSDPENEAWFFKLKIKDKSELDTLMNKEEYEKFSKESVS